MRNLVSYKHRPSLTEDRVTQGIKPNAEEDEPSSWGKQWLRSRFEATSRNWQDVSRWISEPLLDSDVVCLLFLLPFSTRILTVVILHLTRTACGGIQKEDHWSLLFTALNGLKRTVLEELQPKGLSGTWNWSGWLHPGLQVIRWDSENFEGRVKCLLHVERMWIVVDRGRVVANSIYQKWL